MHLHLKNFRCYEDTQFEFGEKGLVLLSGMSGKGKSSILMAIDFALFGNGTKIITHGKKSCSVQLVLGDLKIVRKKGPNHLIVNDVYEDASGEAIIQRAFGKIFNSVSYIPQNPKKSFVLMSPSDRLEFLETFAFKDFDISHLKERAKTVIRDANDTLSKTIGSFRFALNLFEEKKKPACLPFPAKVSKENREKYIANEEVKLKNSITILKRDERKILELTETCTQISILNVKIEERTRVFSKLTEEIEKTSREKDNMLLYGGEENITQLEKKLSQLLANKELISLTKTYNENVINLQELIAKEDAEMREKVAVIRSHLWVDGNAEDISEQIEVWTTLLNLKKEIQSAEKDLSKLPSNDERNFEKLLEETKDRVREIHKELEREKLERESYSCPHCRKRVRFHNNTLINSESNTFESKDVCELQAQLKTLMLVEKTVTQQIDSQKKRNMLEDKISQLTRNVSELEDETTNLDECEESIFTLRESLRKNEEDEKTLLQLEKNIQNKKFSGTINRIEKQIVQDKNKIDSLSVHQADVQNVNEEDLRNEISKQKSEKERLLRLLQNLEKLQKEKKSVENEIFELSQKQPDKNKKDIEQDIQTLTSEISLHTERKEKIETFLKEVEKWRVNEKDVYEYDKLRASVEELREKEIEDRKKYTAACTFRDNILEAESLYVSNLIDNINNNVQLYLDHFFPDYPITIRLTSFKENAKNETKPSINMEIDYKGMEMDLSMLSGGELSRVILSFTLAFADLYNSPLILLDECTSSLDQDLTSSVLEGLKENFGEKLTLIVAHQVVKGVFDKVVEL